MRGTILEVAINISGPTVRFLVFTNVWLGPFDMSLCHSLWMNLTLIGQQNINGAALESSPFVVAVLPKHTLFKVLYFILAKFNNNTLFILFSVKYFKNTLLQDKIV